MQTKRGGKKDRKKTGKYNHCHGGRRQNKTGHYCHKTVGEESVEDESHAVFRQEVERVRHSCRELQVKQ